MAVGADSANCRIRARPWAKSGSKALWRAQTQRAVENFRYPAAVGRADRALGLLKAPRR